MRHRFWQDCWTWQIRLIGGIAHIAKKRKQSWWKISRVNLKNLIQVSDFPAKDARIDLVSTEIPPHLSLSHLVRDATALKKVLSAFLQFHVTRWHWLVIWTVDDTNYVVPQWQEHRLKCTLNLAVPAALQSVVPCHQGSEEVPLTGDIQETHFLSQCPLFQAKVVNNIYQLRWMYLLGFQFFKFGTS